MLFQESDDEDMSGDESTSSSGYEDIWVLRDETDGSVYSNDDEERLDDVLPDEYLKHDPTPDTPYPRPDWITLKELRARKLGFASAMRMPKRQNMSWFQRYASDSLWMIQRMEKTKKLQSHTGCVNCLDFNSSANLICSGSDDLTVNIWDWRLKTGNKRGESIYTGHALNVLQCQFCNQDNSIVTSSRDGSVRLTNIETARSELLMSSSGEIEQLAFINPNTFLACGTNASVNLIDLRTGRARRLFNVINQKNNQKCPLHTISSHPLDKHVIAVAGSSPAVYLYDLRRISRGQPDNEVKPTYCLGNLENRDLIVTSTAFNSLGDKLLISYNDDDLYVCNTKTCATLHKYTGHRNKKTIKGCAWFGDKYVLSGSDDGHIYGWDVESEHIVCFLDGDASVVNCIRVHPDLPVLATSGIEHDIKIWEPNSNTWPLTMKGIKPHICRNALRRKRAKRILGGYDASPSSASIDLFSDDEPGGFMP